VERPPPKPPDTAATP
ncbi:hypothetical protein A2U01_0045796, partial [Trifolium medium]|nr:hypothetical protein [Trifolium medium]